MARFATANGLRFAYRQTGPADGPLALLLHGFPDTPATWRHLAPRLADAGFRVVTPWMRGYAPTQAPADGCYDVDHLAADANRLHAVLGGDDRAVLVGHDWGALASYAAAHAAPERWRRVVTLAVPPEAALQHVRRAPRQLRRSWYTVAAQLPWERLAPERAMARVERLWTDWSPAYAPSAEDLRPLRAAMREPGGLEAMLGYYRSNRRRFVRLGTGRAVTPVPTQPVVYLHGADDGCVDVAWVRPAARILADANLASTVEVWPGAGHFLHLEDPDGVGARIVAWVGT
jgi:pimeloyl-ACP methyl ester carboxylesterase